MMRRSRIEKAEVERRVIRWQMCTLKFEREVLAERWPAPSPASIGRLHNVSLYRKGFDKSENMNSSTTRRTCCLLPVSL